MPREIFGAEYPFLLRKELLTYEEITRLALILADFGIRKIRLTGGEPLLREDLHILVAMLSESLPDIELALTTNGSLLEKHVSLLKKSGLQRVTVSLDALENSIFQKITDVNYPVEKILHGIQAAHAAGLTPIKVNMVVKRGVNENQILPMAEKFRKPGYILRLIEYMDVGNSNQWRLEDVVPAREMVEKIQQRFPLEEIDANYHGEVANRWRYRDGKGEIGIIASVTQPFCGDCTRMRLSAVGGLYTCLFTNQGHDLRAFLRQGASDGDIKAFISQVWGERKDRYSEGRGSGKSAGQDRIEMSYIGG
jgi:cyclic pyranopterin phosphate synthase